MRYNCEMKKFVYYLLLFKKVFYIAIYPLFMGESKFFRFFRIGMENYLIFQPAKFRAQRINRNLLKRFKTVRFVSKDCARLFAWFVEPQKGKPTILYFHGQAESILAHQDVVEFALKNGYGVFMLSYRGHYRSWGLPSEQGIFNDAQAALEKLDEFGVKSKDVILWGHSLGTTVAMNTAVNNEVKALILQSPIKNIQTAAYDVANFYFRRLKIVWLRKYIKSHFKDVKFLQKFDNIGKIAQVNCPILLVHSKTDRVSPSKNSRELYERKLNSQLYLAERGSHWDMDWCIKRIADFIVNL